MRKREEKKFTRGKETSSYDLWKDSNASMLWVSEFEFPIEWAFFEVSTKTPSIKTLYTPRVNLKPLPRGL
jgi:hypothetical protein